MRFIGVDLAWGGKNPSGLAVLDEDGKVVAEDVLVGDGEIAEFVSAHDAGGAVLALDAPLVVRNPTGRRACEAELQRRYGQLGAGPYPSNLTLLHGRVRAMELVQRLPMPYQTVPRDPRRAHVCAYVGLWWWWHGRWSTLVAGDDQHGAILVPVPRGAVDNARDWSG